MPPHKGSNHFAIRVLNFKGNTYDTHLDSTVNGSGRVLITRYDIPARIISGTFEFHLTKRGKETIIVTNGRFDAKL